MRVFAALILLCIATVLPAQAYRTYELGTGPAIYGLDVNNFGGVLVLYERHIMNLDTREKKPLALPRGKTCPNTKPRMRGGFVIVGPAEGTGFSTCLWDRLGNFRLGIDGPVHDISADFTTAQIAWSEKDGNIWHKSGTHDPERLPIKGPARVAVNYAGEPGGKMELRILPEDESRPAYIWRNHYNRETKSREFLDVTQADRKIVRKRMMSDGKDFGWGWGEFTFQDKIQIKGHLSGVKVTHLEDPSAVVNYTAGSLQGAKSADGRYFAFAYNTILEGWFIQSFDATWPERFLDSYKNEQRVAKAQSTTKTEPLRNTGSKPVYSTMRRAQQNSSQSSSFSAAKATSYDTQQVTKVMQDYLKQEGLSSRVISSGWYNLGAQIVIPIKDPNNRDGKPIGDYRVFVWDPSGSISNVCIQYKGRHWVEKQRFPAGFYKELEEGAAPRDCPSWNGLKMQKSNQARGRVLAYGSPVYANGEGHRYIITAGRGGRAYVFVVSQWNSEFIGLD